MEFDIYNVLGLFGTVFYFLSYALLNLNKLQGNSYTYILMNLIGASLVLFSLIKHWNLSSVIIQGGWIIFSIIGIFNIYIRKRKEGKKFLEDEEKFTL
jgi:hypothetical protein